MGDIKEHFMREKNYNLELIRTVSFVLVIVIHVSNYFCRAFGKISIGEYGFSLILDTLTRVSVPCFFMLSGALLLGREEPAENSWKRMFRIVLPLLFWSIVYYLWNLYYMGTEFELYEIFWVPTEAHLWYLYALIPIYLVLPFFQILIRNLNLKMEKILLMIGMITVLVNWGLSIFGGELYYDIPLFGDRVYAFYFFLGYYLKKYQNHRWVRNGKLLLIFIVSNVLNIGLTMFLSVITEDHMEHTLEYGFPLIVISSAAFFLWMLRLGDGKLQLKAQTRKRIDNWCACSFGIYLIHILFLDHYKKYAEAEAVSAYIAIPVLTAVILVISYLCVKVIRKAPGGKLVT